MRLANTRLWLLFLALVATSCAAHHRHHGYMGGGRGCGPEACRYQSKCFSEGAARSNDGVCQACSAGKWVATTGCSDHDCDDCCAKKGDAAPCPHASKHGGRQRK
jgi:hypothetical protein